MDGKRFDKLARTFAAETSRRRLIKTAVGGGIGGLFAALGGGRAGADVCKPEGKECKKHAQCCAGLFCVPPPDAQQTAGSGQACCPPGTTFCVASGRCQECCSNADCNDGNACTTDTCNAGACVHTPVTCSVPNDCYTAVCNPSTGCPAAPTYRGDNAACSAGICYQGSCCTPTTCAEAGKNCGAVVNNCGQTVDCGTCSGYDTCGGGGTENVCGCTPTTCAEAGKNCGPLEDGCGVTLDCGTCSGYNTCSEAGPDQICCDGHCICAFDPQNCGACGSVCPTNLSVRNATVQCIVVSPTEIGCVYVCDRGFAECDGLFDTGCESEVAHDHDNCGRCGHKCEPDEYCCGCECFSNDVPHLCGQCGPIIGGTVPR